MTIAYCIHKIPPLPTPLQKTYPRKLYLCLTALVWVAVHASVLPAETLSNYDFQISSSSTGLIDIHRVHDAYDTNYVAPGQTLGDVTIRYRQVGTTRWKIVSSAYDGTTADQQVAYRIGRVVPTIASSSRAKSSAAPWSLYALNDQVQPQNSTDLDTPFYAWYGQKASEQWVEYDFDKPRQVSSAEVYWVEGKQEDNLFRVPVAWKLQYQVGPAWKDVEASGAYGISRGRFNHIDFQTVTTAALRLVLQLPADATSGIFEWRVNSSEGKQVQAVPEIEPTETFRLQANALVWTIKLRNQSSSRMEVGDLAIPLPFNTNYVWDKTVTYTKRLIRHSFVGGNGSYIFWMRPNAEGPYLVMVPQNNTALEYFDQIPNQPFTAYIHSSASQAELAAQKGNWRLPGTKQILAPKGQPGDSATCQFKFSWAADYNGVRDTLYASSGFDVNVVPGMTIPTDLTAMFSLRTRNRITAVDAEFPAETGIRYMGERGKDVHVYAAQFAHLGENMVKVRYGNHQYLSLEFFVTQPLETLIKIRARFLVTHEQWNDAHRWYNGLYSQWDMKHQVLRSPDDLDGLQSYAVASDDPALGKAPYLAAKNASYPDAQEIASVENYIRHYVWGGLQQTGKEPYPYAIYGIPNWKVNRESANDDQRGRKHIWRIYDYPHVVLLYYSMYQIADRYPTLVHYLDKAEYLERAYGTAIAFFTVPMEIVKWSAYETGTYNELIIPDLIRALDENNKHEQAAILRAHWEKKAKYFINDHPYLFGSEYPFDSTGFESTHALAKYAIKRLSDPEATDFRASVKREDAEGFLDQQMKLNLACRGLEPAYYWLGSDYRASGNASYTLSYMSQMGGWAVEDYAVNYADDPTPYLRLGYASYLSSWALVNSGTRQSNYGYWFPGKENNGGAGGGFEPRPWGRAWLGNKQMGRGSWWYSGEIDLGFSGALRTAATVVADDPIFGLIAYGGDLTHDQSATRVIPKDGLRQRFYIVRGKTRLQMRLDRDGFAAGAPITFDDELSSVKFVLENRFADSHSTVLHVQGLPPGTYTISVDGNKVGSEPLHEGQSADLRLPVSSAATSQVSITR